MCPPVETDRIRLVCTENALCVVQDFNSGHQLLRPPAE